MSNVYDQGWSGDQIGSLMSGIKQSMVRGIFRVKGIDKQSRLAG
jgi:hypothetical protein